MKETLFHLLESLPAGWTTFVVAMLPIVELRGSIPFAIGAGMSWPQAFLVSIAGNLVPVVPLLLFLGPASDRLRRIRLFDRLFTWLFTRTRKRGGAIERYGPLGLVLFVGIPLPGTGAWTGAAAAYVFGIPFRRAVAAISLGVILAGVLVTLAVQGVIGLAGWILG